MSAFHSFSVSVPSSSLFSLSRAAFRSSTSSALQKSAEICASPGALAAPLAYGFTTFIQITQRPAMLNLPTHVKHLFGDHNNISLEFRVQISERNRIPYCITIAYGNL